MDVHPTKNGMYRYWSTAISALEAFKIPNASLLKYWDRFSSSQQRWGHEDEHLHLSDRPIKIIAQWMVMENGWLMDGYRRKFRSYTSDNMDSWKAEVRRVRREKIRRKKMKVAIHCVFPMICGSGGSKSRLAKAAGAEPAGQMREEKLHAVVARSTFPSEKWQNTRGADHFWKLRCRKSARCCGAKHISKSKCTKHANVGPLLEVEMSKKCTPLWREAHFQVKMYKTPQCRTTFGSCDVEKVHAVVARSTFPSQNVQNTPVSDHFWKLRCRKSARRCGAKHISKSKCTKHTNVGPLLEVAMSKKCTPLWCEAHFQVKMLKTLGVRTTFGGSDVEKVHAVVARSTFRSQKCKKLRVLSLFDVKMSKK